MRKIRAMLGFYEAGVRARRLSHERNKPDPVRPHSYHELNPLTDWKDDGTFERAIEQFNPEEETPVDDETLQDVARRTGAGAFEGGEETSEQAVQRWDRTGRGKASTSGRETAGEIVAENAGRQVKNARDIEAPADEQWRLHWVGGHVP